MRVLLLQRLQVDECLDVNAAVLEKLSCIVAPLFEYEAGRCRADSLTAPSVLLTCLTGCLSDLIFHLTFTKNVFRFGLVEL